MTEITLQVGVKVLLKNPENKFLLVKRSAKAYPDAICGWELVGGRITPGMPLLENLKREIKEETGITRVENIKLVAAQDILRIAGKHVVRLTYTADTKNEKVVLDKNENTEYVWVTSKELESQPGLDTYLDEMVRSGTVG